MWSKSYNKGVELIEPAFMLGILQLKEAKNVSTSFSGKLAEMYRLSERLLLNALFFSAVSVPKPGRYIGGYMYLS